MSSSSQSRSFSKQMDLVAKITTLLRARNQTIAFAESCTGGRVSTTMSELPGVSRVYVGSIVAYANSVKTSLLAVSDDLLQTQGAVSAAVALQMAVGVRRRLQTSWGLGVTGIAGPEGGSKEKPVGTVFFGLSGPDLEVTSQQLFVGSRTEIQQQSCDFSLQWLFDHLQTK